jgi:HEPN domain-containing protein
MSANKDIARLWIAKAENDLLDADNNLQSARIPFDSVCFHCQQAAEKLLKAFLAGNGIPPPRTHDLLALSEAVFPLAPSVERLRESLSLLTPYAISARYPDDEGELPDLTDAQEARHHAQLVLNWLTEEYRE